MAIKLAILAIVAAFAVTAWIRSLPLGVPVAKVVRGRAVDAVFATVTVEPRTRIQVRASVSGRVAEVFVTEGQSVKPGQVLVRLEAPQLEAELKRNEAERAATARQAAPSAPAVAALRARAASISARLERARLEEARTETLVARQALPETELLRERSLRASLEAELASTQAEEAALRVETVGRDRISLAQLGVATSRLRDTTIVAPADAVVLSRAIDVGESVVPGQILLGLADISKLHLRSVIDESDALRVEAGMPAAVTLGALPGRVLRGAVSQVRPEAERDGHSLVADIELKDAVSTLRPGFSGEANIVVSEHDAALLVPARAVIADSRIWVVQDGRARQRKVTLGIRTFDVAEIVSGVSEGAEVITDPPERLVDGERVRPESRHADSAAGGAR
jgi:HlyD family secretion protein